MESNKIHQIINDSTIGIWFIITGIGIIIMKKIVQLGNKVVDFVWQAVFEKGAKTVGEAVGKKVSQEVDKQIDVKLEPIYQRLQNIDHRVDSISKAGAFDLILEEIKSLKNVEKNK